MKVVKLMPAALDGCTVLANRASLLEKLPRAGLVAGFGGLDAHLIRLILEKNAPKEFHVIDTSLKDLGESNFSAEVGDKRIILHEGDMAESISRFPEESLDWIYFAGPHHFEKLKALISASESRARHGGYLIFSGYIRHTQLGAEYGVIPAVNDLLSLGGWTMRHFVLQRAGYHQVALLRN